MFQTFDPTSWPIWRSQYNSERTRRQHDRHHTRLDAFDTERHKLLDAYYNDAIPLDLLFCFTVR